MREVVLYSLVSLDGVAEEPGDWMFDADDEVFENLRGVISTQDDILLGRGTYDYWAGYWPTSDVQPFADFINHTTKHVFSSSSLDQPWPETVLVGTSLEVYLEQLKNSPGGDIGVHGSIRLARHLLAGDLIDRLELVIVPTLAGSGRSLLADASALRRLRLSKTAQSSSGCAFLGYQRL